MAGVNRQRRSAGAQGMLGPTTIADPATRAVVDSMQRALDQLARTVNAPAARVADDPEQKLPFMAPIVEATGRKLKLFGRTAILKNGRLANITGAYVVKEVDLGAVAAAADGADGVVDVSETLYAMPLSWLDPQE